MKDLKAGEMFGLGWEGAKNNWLSFCLLGLLYVAVIGVRLILKGVMEDMPMGGLLLFLLYLPVQVMVLMVVNFYCLQVAVEKGGPVSLRELNLDTDTVKNYLVTYLLVVFLIFAAILVVGGVAVVVAGLSLGWDVFSDKAGITSAIQAMLLPLAGLGALVFATYVYLLLTYGMTFQVVMHQGLYGYAALAESKRITDGAKGDIFILGAATLGIMLLGLICLLVGIIPAVMVGTVAWPSAYLSLLEQSGKA